MTIRCTTSTYTLALGPFGITWPAPQRLVLTVEDDVVIDVNYRGGYNERGCAHRIPRLTLEQSLYLVARICGPAAHAHALAFCQALETLRGEAVPDRAAYLRATVAELERMAWHAEVLKALFDALGQQQRSATLQALLQSIREAMALASGSPGLPEVCLPGGVRAPLNAEQRSEIQALLTRIGYRLKHLIEEVLDDVALSTRTLEIGVLAPAAAQQFGLRGPMARASGVEDDARLSEPYAAYRFLDITPIVEHGGDVYARLMVLLLESLESVKIAEQALQEMPDGAWEGALPKEVPAGHASSVVESPQGRLGYTLEGDGRRITAVTIDAPQQLDRLLARALFTGSQIDNVMIIALSIAPCTACAEL